MKQELNQEEIFRNTKQKEIDRLTDVEKQQIGEWFLNREVALKRDKFRCQNQSCITQINKQLLKERREFMTVHHKIARKTFKENPQSLIKRLGYDCDDLQNLTTLCRNCHIKYEKAQIEIVVDGQPYKLEKHERIDFKSIIKEGKRMRRALKSLGTYGWHGISEEDRINLIYLLMKWLTREWTEIAETY